MRFIKIVMTLLLLSTSACNQAIKDYVSGATPSELIKNEPPTKAEENAPMSLKITPGKFKGSSANGSIQGTITATNKKFSAGPDMSVSLTISRTRVSPQ